MRAQRRLTGWLGRLVGVIDGVRTRVMQLHKLPPRLSATTTKNQEGPGVSAEPLCGKLYAYSALRDTAPGGFTAVDDWHRGDIARTEGRGIRALEVPRLL